MLNILFNIVVVLPSFIDCSILSKIKDKFSISALSIPLAPIGAFIVELKDLNFLANVVGESALAIGSFFIGFSNSFTF